MLVFKDLFLISVGEKFHIMTPTTEKDTTILVSFLTLSCMFLELKVGILYNTEFFSV